MSCPTHNLELVPAHGAPVAGEVWQVELPLPPPDNALHRTGGLVRYPTVRYKDWLAVAEGVLYDALPKGHVSDTSQWWVIQLDYYMAAMGDMPNREKAVLDLLGGSTLRGGKIEKSGRGLFDDDRRVKRVVKSWCEIGTPLAAGRVVVTATVDPDGAPVRFAKPSKRRKALEAVERAGA